MLLSTFQRLIDEFNKTIPLGLWIQKLAASDNLLNKVITHFETMDQFRRGASMHIQFEWIATEQFDKPL